MTCEHATYSYHERYEQGGGQKAQCGRREDQERNGHLHNEPALVLHSTAEQAA